MAWTVSFKDEPESGSKELVDGLHKGKIKEVIFFSKDESKSGNPYFQWLLDVEGVKIKHFTTGLKGKRWALKQILSACGIEANPNDPEEKYSFEPKDVLEKEVLVTTRNKENRFTGRDDKEVCIMKPEIIRVEKASNDNDKPKESEVF